MLLVSHEKNIDFTVADPGFPMGGRVPIGGA